MSGFPPPLDVLQADLEVLRARKRRLEAGGRAAAALKAMREEQGSLSALARRAGVCCSSLTLWLGGGRPTAVNARRLEQALGLPEAWWEEEAEGGDAP